MLVFGTCINHLLFKVNWGWFTDGSTHEPYINRNTEQLTTQQAPRPGAVRAVRAVRGPVLSAIRDPPRPGAPRRGDSYGTSIGGFMVKSTMLI